MSFASYSTYIFNLKSRTTNYSSFKYNLQIYLLFHSFVEQKKRKWQSITFYFFSNRQNKKTIFLISLESRKFKWWAHLFFTISAYLCFYHRILWEVMLVCLLLDSCWQLQSSYVHTYNNNFTRPIKIFFPFFPPNEFLLRCTNEMWMIVYAIWRYGRKF